MSPEDDGSTHHFADARQYPGEKPRYRDLTYFGEQQLGNFILTDKRILFLRKTSMARIFGAATLELASFLAGLPAAIIAGHMAGARMESAKIKPDEVEKVLKEDPESTIIPLENIVQVEAKRAYLFTAYLTLWYNTPQGPSTSSFVFGTAAKSRKELVEAIREAKRNLA